MNKKWLELLQNIKEFISSDNLDETFFTNYYYKTIKFHYDNPNRFYHTFKHIRSLLFSLDDFHLTEIEKIKIELAIWFHDLIYNAKSKTNEIDSVDEFISFGLQTGLSINFIEEICDIILVTQHNNTAHNRLQKIMCDIDLKEFAYDNYIENSNNVKKEFGHLTDDEWKKGRSNFLKTFINKEFIYYTDKYKDALEDTAKINLQKELDYINKDGIS